MQRAVRFENPAWLRVHQIDNRTVRSSRGAILQRLMRNVLRGLNRVQEGFVLDFDRRAQGRDFQGDSLLYWKLRLDLNRESLRGETFAPNRQLIPARRQG